MSSQRSDCDDLVITIRDVGDVGNWE